MKTTTSGTIVGLCLGLALGFATPAANAQMAEVKEKPRMYTYQASWEIPRARWAEYAKGNPTSDKILDKALAY